MLQAFSSKEHNLSENWGNFFNFRKEKKPLMISVITAVVLVWSKCFCWTLRRENEKKYEGNESECRDKSKRRPAYSDEGGCSNSAPYIPYSTAIPPELFRRTKATGCIVNIFPGKIPATMGENMAIATTNGFTLSSNSVGHLCIELLLMNIETVMGSHSLQKS